MAEINIRFKQLTPEHGLSQSSVVALRQDKQGFMWLGTQDGLNRYDGYQFKVFRHDEDDPNSISANWITALHEDHRGMLWVGTLNGLNHFDKNNEQFVHYLHDPNNVNSLSHNIITSIVEDKQGILWIGTRSGLNRFDRQTGAFTRYHHVPTDNDSLSHDWVTAIHEDKRGGIWVGTRAGGLNLFDSETGVFRHFRHSPLSSNSLSGDRVTALVDDPQGQLWIGTYNQGLDRLDIDTGRFVHYKHDANDGNTLTNNRVTALWHDSGGALWVGTDRGLNRYNAQQNQFLRLQHDPAKPDSLIGNRVASLYEDNTGLIWIGMVAGLSLFDPRTEHFGHYRKASKNANSLSNNIVWSLMKDRNGIIWVGTDEGLNRFDRKTNRYTHYHAVPEDPTSLSDRRVMTLFHAQSGEHWIGTFNGGVNILDEKSGQFEHYRHDPNDPLSLSHDRVFALAEDKHNVMWVGTKVGLNRYDSETGNFRRYLHDPSDPSSLSDNHVLALYKDHQGTLWVGTRYGGLNRFNPKSNSFTRYFLDSANPYSLSHNRVYSLAEDLDDNLWVATKAGLNRFVPQEQLFIRYQKKQGLVNNTIYGVVADKRGDLWLSSNKGLSRFDVATPSFRHFDFNDGLQGNEFNSRAAFGSDDGELLFGGSNGFNVFYPQSIATDVEPPNTVVTDLLLFNQSVPLQRSKMDSPLSQSISQTKAITLSHKDAVFAFEFAAIDFAHPGSHRYAYQLLGHDDEWLYTDANNRRATYTSLDPGTYQFIVKGANKNGQWGEQTTPIMVTVLPSIWQTWWAYSFYCLAGLSVIVLIGYQRQQKLAERHRSYLITKKRKEQLQLALWGSGDQLWDVDILNRKIKRKNILVDIDYSPITEWHLPDLNDEYIHPDDRAQMKKKIMKHFEEHSQFCEITYRARTKNGTWMWLMDRGQVVEWDNDGKPLRFSGTTKNIHKLKSTEAELLALTQDLEQRVESRTLELRLRTQELIQSNEYLKNTQSQLVELEKMASLGGLVAGVSHEINTPVGTAITALSDMKERNKVLFDNAAQGKMTRAEFAAFKVHSEERLELALTSLDRASDLVEDFKQIAVNRSGETLCEMQLDELLDDVITASMLNATVDKDSVSVVCQSRVTLTTYPDAFAKVFFHLVRNTLVHGYSPDEKVAITVHASLQKSDIVILYRDEGKGMDQQTLDHIFDPFYTTNRTGGKGLGMHVVYNRVCQLLKGQISCYSEPGKGCQFTLRLPLDLTVQHPGR